MAVRTITTRLTLDGEAQFKQAMTSVNASLRAMKSELALSETQFRGQANTVEALTAKDKLLRQEIEQQTVKVKALAQALKDAAQVYGQDSNQVSNYQAQLNRAKIELAGMDQALRDNTRYLNEARDSAKGTASSIDEFGFATRRSSDAVDSLAVALQAAGLALGLKKISDSIYACVDASKGFESSMASFNKVAKLSDEELAEMADQIQALSTKIPATTSEIAQVAEASRRLGIAQEDVLSFTRVMVDLGNVSDLSADQAATALARFANIVGTSSKDYERLGSTIVSLGNNFATSESEITNMASRLASAGKLAGLSEAQILGLAAAMSSVGIEAEAGGTAMTQTLTAMEKAVTSGGAKLESFARVAGMSSEQFADAWQREPIVAIQAFIAGLGQLDEKGESATLVLEELGLSGIRQGNMLRSLALANETLTGTLDTANRAWAENSELAATAAERYDTTEAKLQMMDNAVNNVKIAVGDALMPALGALAEAGTAAFGWTADFLKDNPIIVQALAGVAAGLGALTIGLGAHAAATKLAALAQTEFNAALLATPVGQISLAVGALVGVVTAYTYATSQADQTVKELTKSVEESDKALVEQMGAIQTSQQDTLAMVSALEDLADRENKTAAEKETLISLVDQLNEKVPELGLSYDALNDSLNMTAEQIRQIAIAEAQREAMAAVSGRLSEAYVQQYTIAKELEEAQKELAEAERAYAEAEQEVEAAYVGASAASQELTSDLSAAQQKVADLTALQEKNNSTINELEGAYNAAADSIRETASAIDMTVQSTQAAKGPYDELIESAAALEEATLYVTGAQDALTEALQEQQKNGSLSVETTQKMIDAGYGAALALDEETGAVIVDQEAYLALANAKLQEQISSLETQRQSAINAQKLAEEKREASGLASAYWDAAGAIVAKNAAEDITSLDKQIAALRQAQEALANYSFNADQAALRSSAASKRIKTQAEEDLETYKALKTALDHEKTMELVGEEEYYRRLEELRDQYLTDEGNVDEYRKITEQIYKYDKSLADQEAQLWADQTDTLIGELEDRLKSVTAQQDKMEDKLSGYGDLFEIRDNEMTLENIQEQIDAINAYEDALNQLKERNISGGLMDEVLNMDVDSATQYAKQLLEMSEDQWEQYNDLWDEKQQLAMEVAEQFFKDQLDVLETEYNDKLDSALSELTDTSFASGVDTAQGLIDGLASKEDALYAQAQSMASRVSEILAGAGRIPSNSELAASFSTERIAERFQGVTPRDMQNASAGVVNGVSAAMAGQGGGDLIVEAKIDSTTFYRETIPNFRKVDAENPGTLGDG